jgi:hypothetical protein
LYDITPNSPTEARRSASRAKPDESTANTRFCPSDASTCCSRR